MFERILANVARHVLLTPAEEQFFTSLLRFQHLARHDYVLLAGQPARCLTFVERGCLRTYVTDAQGAEAVLGFAWEDWWCGDATATSTTQAVQALEPTDVVQLPLDQLERLCEQVPKFERFFRILGQNGLRFEQQQRQALLQGPAPVRYARFCRQFPGLSQRVALKHIASYLGITPEFLSMLRKKAATGNKS